METNRTGKRDDALPGGSLETTTEDERTRPVLRGIVSAGRPSWAGFAAFNAGRRTVPGLTNRL